MVWKLLDSPESFDSVLEASHHKVIAIFKHSTSCSISHMAKMRIEEHWDLHDVDLHYLDLKAHRNISNTIAENLSVPHESPQILLIKNGECIYDASHFDISIEEIKESLDWHATHKYN